MKKFIRPTRPKFHTSAHRRSNAKGGRRIPAPIAIDSPYFVNISEYAQHLGIADRTLKDYVQMYEQYHFGPIVEPVRMESKSHPRGYEIKFRTEQILGLEDGEWLKHFRERRRLFVRVSSDQQQLAATDKEDAIRAKKQAGYRAARKAKKLAAAAAATAGK